MPQTPSKKSKGKLNKMPRMQFLRNIQNFVDVRNLFRTIFQEAAATMPATTTQDFLTVLPTDIIKLIISFLSIFELLSLSGVNRRLRWLLTDDAMIAPFAKELYFENPMKRHDLIDFLKLQMEFVCRILPLKLIKACGFGVIGKAILNATIHPKRSRIYPEIRLLNNNEVLISLEVGYNFPVGEVRTSKNNILFSKCCEGIFEYSTDIDMEPIVPFSIASQGNRGNVKFDYDFIGRLFHHEPCGVPNEAGVEGSRITAEGRSVVYLKR